MYANYLIYILTIYRKHLLFQFLGSRIRTQIPILIVVQKGHISLYKSGHNLLKNGLLKLNFEHDGHLHACC